jgi:hypothetical protein
MKKYVLFTCLILLFLSGQINGQIKMPSKGKVDYPDVPRVSAYGAYLKYKGGKAIIMHAGGEAYNARHILGAFDLTKNKDQLLLKFPKQGIEIFTYCY